MFMMWNTHIRALFVVYGSLSPICVSTWTIKLLSQPPGAKFLFVGIVN